MISFVFSVRQRWSRSLSFPTWLLPSGVAEECAAVAAAVYKVVDARRDGIADLVVDTQGA